MRLNCDYFILDFRFLNIVFISMILFHRLNISEFLQAFYSDSLSISPKHTFPVISIRPSLQNLKREFRRRLCNSTNTLTVFSKYLQWPVHLLWLLYLTIFYNHFLFSCPFASSFLKANPSHRLRVIVYGQRCLRVFYRL